MRALAVLPILLAVSARADELTDRMAIRRTIHALNGSPPRNGLFTQDASISPEFERLRGARRISYRLLDPAGGARPTVTISHEPWGEATIGWSPIRVELTPSRIVAGEIRFVTSDVATADGASLYEGEAARERTRLFFVLRREGEEWKIAAVRVLGSH